MGDYQRNSGFSHSYDNFNIESRQSYLASAPVHYNTISRNERPSSNFCESEWDTKTRHKISLDAYKGRKLNNTSSTAPSTSLHLTSEDSTSRHRYNPPKPSPRDSWDRREPRCHSDSGRSSENPRDPRDHRSRYDSMQRHNTSNSSFNITRRPEPASRVVKDDRIKQVQSEHKNYVQQFESKPADYSGVKDLYPSWDQPGPPVPKTTKIESSWSIPASPATKTTYPAQSTTNPPPSCSQTFNNDGDDDIVFLKRSRTDRSKKQRIVIDLESPRRPVKQERIDPDLTIKMETPLDSTVNIHNSPPPPSSTPIPNLPHFPLDIPPAPKPVPVQVSMPIPLTTSTSTSSNHSHYEPLAGISLKMEAMQNFHSQDNEEEQSSDPVSEEKIHRPSVVCETCHLRVSHICKYPPKEQQGNFIIPGKLYYCKCNFMFFHKFNCGMHKKKDAFAPVSRQNGLIKQVNRIHDFECHQCPFKFFLEGLKLGDHYFEKLKKTDLAHPCEIIERVNKVCRRLYQKEIRLFKASTTLPYILRSEEDYAIIRRNHILRCTAGCCKVYHECCPKELHENRD